MSPALSLTRDDLVRALSGLGDRRVMAPGPAIDRAVAERAAALAREIEEIAGADGVTARVVRRGAATYEIVVSGPGLFAREFGSLTRAAEPVIAAAIDRAGRPSS